MGAGKRSDRAAGRISHARGRSAAFAHAARSFVGETSGATAIEYALIGTIISIVVVTSVTLIGTNLSGFFDSVANGFR
jgi:pilus assembly protein Flp/PilA